MTTAFVIFAVFVGCFVHGTVGFGNAMVMLPLLTLTLSTPMAVPLVALLGPFATFYVLYHNRIGFDVQTVLCLLISSIFGLPLGLMVLDLGSPDNVKRLLGALLFAYAVYALVVEYRLRKKGPIIPETPADAPAFNWWRDYLGAAVTGFLSGITAGAFSMNGPPVIVYGTYCAWPREKFKSVLQGYFLISNVLIVIAHALKGFTTTTVLWYFVVATPAAAVGLFFGQRLSTRFNQDQFRLGVLILILILGIVLLF